MVANQFLTFRLDQEIFALEIGKVREVLDFRNLTRVPRMPDFMRGVINLRGNVVPVVDLRLAFGMEQTTRTVNTCVVIAEIHQEGGPLLLGALADAVQEVIDLDAAQIEPAPAISGLSRVPFIQGMGKTGEDFIIILDIDLMFSAEQLLGWQDRADGATLAQAV